MKRNKLPNGVLSRLVELDEQVEDLTRKLANTEQGIADARGRLTGSFSKQAEYDDLSASLKELVADKPTLEKKLHTAQSVLSNCKVWLD
jgi:predicted  nucleic acid-binding Zn-ribbon protein